MYYIKEVNNIGCHGVSFIRSITLSIEAVDQSKPEDILFEEAAP